MHASSILSRLRNMTDDQLCRWVTARCGDYTQAEREAVSAFMLELPFNGRALPVGMFNKKAPSGTGA